MEIEDFILLDREKIFCLNLLLFLSVAQIKSGVKRFFNIFYKCKYIDIVKVFYLDNIYM